MSLPDIIIRAAVSSDTAALSKLAYRSKQANGYDDATMALFAKAFVFTPDRLSKHRFWIAQDGTEIVGCIALDPIENHTSEVRTFYVAPEYQKRGIGSRLWQTMTTIAQTQGVTRLVGQVDAASLDFYLGLGCKKVKMVPSRNAPGLMRHYIIRDI